MNKKPILFVLPGLTIAMVSIFMITLGNDAFAIEYSKYLNNKYGIKFDYPNIVYLYWIDPSNEKRYNNIIIPVGANFKDPNNVKISICAQSYHKMIPKIYQDDKSYWEGSVVACTYGLYNYKVNIGEKNLDPLLRIQIEGEAQICMFDDHCMKKINNIIKGKIALEYEFPLPPAIQKYEEERKKAQPGAVLAEKERMARGWEPYTTTDKDKKGFIDRDDDDVKEKNIDESKQKINLTTEEQELIKSCALYFYAINQQPQDCKDLKPELKQQVQIEAEERLEDQGFTKTQNEDDDDKKKNKK